MVPTAIGLLADPVAQVREAAVILLGHSRDPARAFSPLLSALREGPPEVRFQATVALAALDLTAALPHLLETLADADPEVRGNAVSAIGQALTERGAGRESGPHAADLERALLPVLSDADPRPRFEAATVLARHGERAAVPVLCDCLLDRDRALDAAQALSFLPDPRAAAPLRALLDRWLTPPLLRLRAAHALALIDADPKHAAHAALARDTLRRALDSRREEVRGLARELLDDLAARPVATGAGAPA